MKQHGEKAASTPKTWDDYIDDQAGPMPTDYKKFMARVMDSVPYTQLPEGALADAMEQRVEDGTLRSIPSARLEYLIGLPEESSSKTA